MLTRDFCSLRSERRMPSDHHFRSLNAQDYDLADCGRNYYLWLKCLVALFRSLTKIVYAEVMSLVTGSQATLRICSPISIIKSPYAIRPLFIFRRLGIKSLVGVCSLLCCWSQFWLFSRQSSWFRPLISECSDINSIVFPQINFLRELAAKSEMNDWKKGFSTEAKRGKSTIPVSVSTLPKKFMELDWTRMDNVILFVFQIMTNRNKQKE